MLVVTRDNGLKRAIKRLTTATGATADFVPDSGQPASKPVDLAILDVREGAPDRRFLSALPAKASVLFIVAEGQLIERLPLLEETRAVSIFCHDERFDDDEFISSATKALRGEVFGLQKYFPWGVTTFTMLLKNYQEKGRAIDIMMAYAVTAGVRGPVRDRIQLVADELMMNALYHAPVDASGRERYAGRSLKDLAKLDEVNPIQVQYGCSGRYFGLAVRDGSGSLRRDRALEYLLRAKSGTHIETKSTGAGLGLVSVLSSVSKLIFNMAPGSSTEVIGLFDMDLFGKGKVGARSLHLFVAQQRVDSAAEPEAERDDTSTDRASPPRRNATWALAAILGAGVAALGTAVVMEKNGGVARAERREPAGLTVVAEPSTAEIRVNGSPVAAGSLVELALGRDAQVTVSATGYAPWSRNLRAADLAPGMQIYVRLDAAE